MTAAVTASKKSDRSYPRLKPGHILYVVILGMLTAFGPFCTDLYLPALPEVGAALHAEPSLIQLSLAACFLGLALGQIIAGPLSDALGRRIPLLVSLILFVLASLACAQASEVKFLIAMRFVQGLSGAGGLVLSRAMACDLFSGSRLTSFMAMLMTINSIAPIAGPIFGSFLIAMGSWHVTFWFLAVWGMLLFVLSSLKLKETLPPKRRQGNFFEAVVSMFRELGNKPFLTMALAMGFINGAFFAYLAASPFVFQVIYGFSEFGYAVIFAVNALSITLFTQLAGRLAKRLGDENIVFYSLFGMLICGTAMIAAAALKPDHPALILIALFTFCGLQGSSLTAGFGLTMARRRGAAGAASGIFGVLCFLFGAVMSPLAGIMGEHSLWPLALCMFLNVLISYILCRRAIKRTML